QRTLIIPSFASYFHLPIPPPSPPLFSFTPPSTTPIYTLSLHDALPISVVVDDVVLVADVPNQLLDQVLESHDAGRAAVLVDDDGDRKSTRLNSSHLGISYAVFCLKKKKINTT